MPSITALCFVAFVATFVIQVQLRPYLFQTRQILMVALLDTTFAASSGIAGNAFIQMLADIPNG